MKILLLSWNKYCKLDNETDMTNAFKQLGHEVVSVNFDIDIANRYSNKATIVKIEEYIRSNDPDFVFSFGYFPVAAHACRNQDVKYVSWVYDNPYVLLYSYTVPFTTNIIFVFDTDTFEFFRKEGITNVHFLPMAVNTERLSSLKDDDVFKKSVFNNAGDVSFVGSLYNEKLNLYDRMEVSEYTRGYLDAIISFQRTIYGSNIVEKSLTEPIIREMKNSLDLHPDTEGVETYEWLYANYVINRKITALERKEFIEQIAKKHVVDLYTNNGNSLECKNVINHGFADYLNVAPYVFKNAKINLNITLRSIVNGIPLRCFDIMGAGGFMLTNYQGDLLRLFNPDEDFVLYESMDDMIEKIDYYLLPSTENERKEIAQNGLRKVEKSHTYLHRAREIMSYIK